MVIPALIDRRKFCSRNCYSNYQSIHETGEKNHNWKGGKIINTFGYVLLLIPEHHRAGSTGYVFEHIVIAEKKLGKSISSDFIIHHINEIKNDNKPENLKIMTKSEHGKIHDLETRRDSKTGRLQKKGTISCQQN